MTRILLIETLSNFRTTYTCIMYVLGCYKFKCFVYPAYLSCVSHSVDICTVAIKNIWNMQAVSTNQIADILHFNDNKWYSFKCFNTSEKRVKENDCTLSCELFYNYLSLPIDGSKWTFKPSGTIFFNSVIRTNSETRILFFIV